MMGQDQAWTSSRVQTIQWDLAEVARRLAEGIGKLAGNTLGDYRKKIGRLTARMPEATRLTMVNHPYPGVRAAEPPRLAGFGLYPKKIGSGRRCASRRRTPEWT
ncbi:hypothetical protein GW17_00024069 [Ensete ventricosum]|nr:hypothetical protein GW17_00024069 [Ensete ventricosum]